MFFKISFNKKCKNVFTLIYERILFSFLAYSTRFQGRNTIPDHIKKVIINGTAQFLTLKHLTKKNCLRENYLFQQKTCKDN